MKYLIRMTTYSPQYEGCETESFFVEHDSIESVKRHVAALVSDDTDLATIYDTKRHKIVAKYVFNHWQHYHYLNK